MRVPFITRQVRKVYTAEQYVCVTCGRTDSPEWRKVRFFRGYVYFIRAVTAIIRSSLVSDMFRPSCPCLSSFHQFSVDSRARLILWCGLLWLV